MGRRESRKQRREAQRAQKAAERRAAGEPFVDANGKTIPQATLQHVVDIATSAAAQAALHMLRTNRGAAFARLTTPDGEPVGCVAITFNPELATLFEDAVKGEGNYVELAPPTGS